MNNSINGTSASSVKKKKNQKSGRFNFIDFILVLIVLMVIAAVIYVFAPFSWLKTITSSRTGNIQYTVEFTGVDEEFINKIKENNVVVDVVSKNNMGTVTAVENSTKYTELQSVQGNGVLVEYSDRYNVIVTIYATADYAEGSGYTVNGCRIAVGEKMTLRFPDYVGEGYCIGLTQS